MFKRIDVSFVLKPMVLLGFLFVVFPDFLFAAQCQVVERKVAPSYASRLNTYLANGAYLPPRSHSAAAADSCTRWQDDFNAVAHNNPFVPFGPSGGAWIWNQGYSIGGSGSSNNDNPDYPGYVKTYWFKGLSCTGTWWRDSGPTWCSNRAGCPGVRYAGESYICAYNSWCSHNVPIENDGRGAASLYAYCPIGYVGVEGASIEQDACVIQANTQTDGICRVYLNADGRYEKDVRDPDCASASCPSPKNDGSACARRDPGLEEGNPINGGTGNKLQVETHFAGGGPFRLEITYSYNSFANKTVSGYDRRIVGSGNVVRLQRPDGREMAYVYNGQRWTADADVIGVLQRFTDAKGNATGWRFLNEKDETEDYNANGQLITLHNRLGQRQTRTVKADGAIVADMFGRRLVETIDSLTKKSTITLPDAGILTVQYNASGNLSSIVYPDGTSRTYHYEDSRFPNNLTGITDENGARYATWSYDAQGRAISSEHADGADRVTLVYNSGNTVVTDARGTSRTKNLTTILGVTKSTGESQPGGSGCGPASASVSYDANGNISSRTDFNGNVTAYTYDLARNLETKRVEAAGQPEARTISTQWHAYWRLPVKVAEPNQLTTYVYNGDVDAGQVVSCAPAEATVPSLAGGTQPIGVLCRKREQSTTDANGSAGFGASVSGPARTWHWTYNQYGQVLTADGPRSDVSDLTTYTYHDAADPDLGKRGQLASVTNALGQVTQITAYDASGNPLTVIDPNGVATTLTYDARQRLTSRRVGSELTGYQYDGVGQLTRITLPDGSHLAYTYDAAHRLTAISDAQGNQILYTLDAMGNRIQEAVTDPQGALARTRARAYDALNRLQTLTGAGNE